LSDTKYKTTLTSIITDNNVGRILRNIIVPFFIPSTVFFLSKTKDIKVNTAVKIIIGIIV